MRWIVRYAGEPVGNVAGPATEAAAIASWLAGRDPAPPVDLLSAIEVRPPARRTRVVPP